MAGRDPSRRDCEQAFSLSTRVQSSRCSRQNARELQPDTARLRRCRCRARSVARRRGDAAAAVAEEPPPLRGHPLRGRAVRSDPLGRGDRGLRRLLRRLERRVPRQRRPRRRGRPPAPGQAATADRPGRAAAADGARARRSCSPSSPCGIAAALGPWSLACLLAFVSLQAAYTLALKHVVLVDVAVIALSS